MAAGLVIRLQNQSLTSNLLRPGTTCTYGQPYGVPHGICYGHTVICTEVQHK